MRDGYCKKVGLEVGKVKLKFDGEILKLNSTSQMIDMDDDDIIDVQISKKWSSI